VHNSSLERLRKRSEFLAVSKTGERWVTPAFIIQVYYRASEGSSRYGITASRKVGGAVERNRAKRRLRALIRKALPSFTHPGVDYVFIARNEVLRRDFSLMKQELCHAVKMLHR
jgi:ribonuclease P protein component